MSIEKEQTRIHNKKVRHEKCIHREKMRKEQQIDDIERKLDKLLKKDNNVNVHHYDGEFMGMGF